MRRVVGGKAWTLGWVAAAACAAHLGCTNVSVDVGGVVNGVVDAVGDGADAAAESDAAEVADTTSPSQDADGPGDDTTPLTDAVAAEDISADVVTDDLGPDVAAPSDAVVTDGDVDPDVETTDPADAVTAPDGADPDVVADDAVDVSDEEVWADASEPPDGNTLIGRLSGSPPAQTFELLHAGDDIEITQGPQGGIHLEVALQADGGAESKLVVELSCTTHIGEQVGSVFFEKYVIYAAAPGVFRTQIVPVFFEDPNAATYVGQTATVTCELSGLLSATGSVTVHLVDLLP